VEVTTSEDPVRGVIIPAADVFLVRDGLIVTMPLPQDLVGRRLDLDAGEAERLPAEGTLVPCEGRNGSSVQSSLPPGQYELYVRLVLNHDDGTSLESIGGPWQLTLHQ
jgi:hypothetical protein